MTVRRTASASPNRHGGETCQPEDGIEVDVKKSTIPNQIIELFQQMNSSRISKEHLQAFLENPDKVLPDARVQEEFLGVLPHGAKTDTVWLYRGKIICESERDGYAYLHFGEKEYGPYAEVGQHAVVGNDLVYAAKKGSRRYVFYGEKKFGPYQEVDYRHIQNHIVFIARKGSEWFVIADGRLEGPYDRSVGMEMHDMDGTLVYIAERDGMHFVVKDGKIGVRRYSKHYLFRHGWGICTRDGHDYVTDGTTELGPYQAVRMIHWCDGKLLYLMRRDGKEYVVFGEQEYGPFDSDGSENFLSRYDGNWSSKIADGVPLFCAKKDGNGYLFHGDTAFGPIDLGEHMSPFYIDYVDGKPLFTARKDGKTVVMHGNEILRSYDIPSHVLQDVYARSLHHGKMLACAKLSHGTYVDHGEERYGPYEAVWHAERALVSGDGHVRYHASRGGRWYLFEDFKQVDGPFDSGSSFGETEDVLIRDGKHSVRCGGREAGPFDLVKVLVADDHYGRKNRVFVADQEGFLSIIMNGTEYPYPGEVVAQLNDPLKLLVVRGRRLYSCSYRK